MVIFKVNDSARSEINFIIVFDDFGDKIILKMIKTTHAFSNLGNICYIEGTQIKIS